MELLGFIVLFVVSLAILVRASDWFVAAAEAVGLALGVSPFIIGVTIVAFGTSLPELAASIAAVLSGSSEIVVGNVIGSNVTNILLVLGLTAIFNRRIRLDFNVMDTDMPLLIASAFLLWFMLADLRVSIVEATLLVIGLIIFLRNSTSGEREDSGDRPRATFRNFAMLVIGAGLVYLGAHFTIVGIKGLSELIGINSEVIALTGVALGTSLPEVVVSITAARRGNAAMAVGNVLGSNVFNTFAVMGIPAFIGPLTIPQGILDFSLPFMIAVTVVFALLCISPRISKWEGWMLVLFYIFFLYNSFLIQ